MTSASEECHVDGCGKATHTWGVDLKDGARAKPLCIEHAEHFEAKPRSTLSAGHVAALLALALSTGVALGALL